MCSYIDFSNKTLNYLSDSSSDEIFKAITLELNKDWKAKGHNLSGKNIGVNKFKIHRKFSGIYLTLYLGAIDNLVIILKEKHNQKQTELIVESVYGIITKMYFWVSMFLSLIGLVIFIITLQFIELETSLYFLIIPGFGLFFGLILMFWREDERNKLIKSFEKLLTDSNIELKNLEIE